MDDLEDDYEAYLSDLIHDALKAEALQGNPKRFCELYSWYEGELDATHILYQLTNIPFETAFKMANQIDVQYFIKNSQRSSISQQARAKYVRVYVQKNLIRRFINNT